MRIAVIGAGNGGQAMSAYLSLKGCQVNLYNRNAIRIEAVREIGGIFLTGVSSGFGKLAKVTTNIAEAISNVEYIMVVTPATAHRSLARKMAPFLKEGHKIILNPGRTGGALEFYNVLRSENCGADIIISEAQTFIFASRIIGPARARIYGIKNHVSIAAFPSNRTRELTDDLSDILPQYSPVENVLKTGFDNIGAIFHPAPTLLNMAWIESTGGCFKYYQDGISPTVCKIIKKMDLERIKVAEAYNIDPLSAEDWMRLSYGTNGKSLYELLRNNIQYKGITAPANINHRYVLEDVPMSLVPISSFASMAGIKTPTIDLIINLANSVYNRDFFQEGRTVDSLGITGLSIRQLINLVNNGSTEKLKIHPAVHRRLIKNIEINNLIYNDFSSYQKEVE